MANKKASVRRRKMSETIKWNCSDEFFPERTLTHVQRKLDRFNELASRLAVEVPDLNPEKLLTRIKKRKAELIKEITAAEKRMSKMQWGGEVPMPLPIPDGSGGPLRPSQQYLDRAYIPWPEGMMRRCILRNGHSQKPLLDATKLEWLCLNHHSTASYSVDDRYFDDYANFLFWGVLNDDAAWWRDDTPDAVLWAGEADYYFPEPECDAILSCEAWVRVISEFTNAADDGGNGYHSVAFGHTDADGCWPESVNLSAIQVILLQLEDTGHYDSEWHRFSFSFKVNGGVTPGLAMVLTTYLSAQDGKVSSRGQWLISPRIYYRYEYA